MTSNTPESPDRDKDRDKALYQYLLTLTDVSRDRDEKYREGDIVEQWGMSDNRMFVRRVVRSLEPEKYGNLDIPPIPGITLSRLVHILSSIDKYRKEQSQRQDPNKLPQILTRAEKLKALRLYAKLLPPEREALNWEPNERESELLLQQLLDDLTDPNTGLTADRVFKICKTIQGDLNLDVGGRTEDVRDRDIDRIIAASIDKIAADYSQADIDRLKDSITKKVREALQDIKYHNGYYQLNKFLDNDVQKLLIRHTSGGGLDREIAKIKKRQQEVDLRFSPPQFIYRLTKSILENELLNQKFPVYIKFLEFKEIHPLPSADRAEFTTRSRLSSHHVKIYFYLKNAQEQLEEFEVETVGVGSPLSHGIAAINRALLWDIPCLQEYVPIAKEITLQNEVIGLSTNGSVWTHYVVGLCKRKTIADALDYKVKNTSLVAEIACGDYCGFDLLEVSLKAAFYARLRAIEQTGISPAKYIRELQEKIKQSKHLRDGEKILSEYPFSLEAMRSFLRESLLKSCYGEDQNNCPVPESVKIDKPWTLTHYEAHLSITEAYLKEGLYAIGKKYLDCIEHHIKEYAGNPINKIILARYHLCYFRYHYLTDLRDLTNPNRNRNAAVENAHQHLDFAYQHLKDYVYKCELMNELPHINFYDFFTVMSKLYAHRAKLFFFMSTYQTNQSIDKPIELFEEARMYAARSGNPGLYAMWTGYLSWCYIVAAYDEHSQNRDEYLKKASVILNNALQAYQETGQHNYESIKVASGKIVDGKQSDSRPYGNIKIQAMPSIQESEGKPERVYSPETNSLKLNMSDLQDDKTKTLLFGTQASMLFFFQGMFTLARSKVSENLKTDLKTARKMFCYSWSFAEDGLDNKRQDGDFIKFDRWFKSQDKDKIVSQCQELRGLYPHRLTQFADFGKIYFVVCELILLAGLDRENLEERWNYIEELLERLKENKLQESKADQVKYNGHLEEHFRAIKSYVVEEFHEKLIQGKKQFSPIVVRDIVLRDIAKIMRTGQQESLKLPQG